MAGYIGSKASVVSSGAERKKTFTITGATTSLTGLNYTVGKVHVFQNGVRLVDGTDYTATNGTTITLTVAAQNGDNVVVISQADFQVADALLTTGGTMTGALTTTGLTVNGNLALPTNTAYTSANSIRNSSNALIFSGGTSGYYFNRHNNSATDLSIDSSGNVGIGTDSPAYKLETKNGDISTIKLISASGGNAVNGMRFRVHNSANTAQSATLGMVNAETVSGWGGVLTFSTKPTNSTPNEAVTERMRVDHDGRVTMPYQPAFVATNISTSTLANESTPIFNNTVTNRGSIYNTSNGRFTVTVAGLYALGAHIRVHSDTNTISYHRVSFQKNGSYVQHTRGRLEGRTSGDYSYMANYMIIELAVNDYITTRIETASGTTLNISSPAESSFYGHLIG
jgi:hypothetical protein